MGPTYSEGGERLAVPDFFRSPQNGAKAAVRPRQNFVAYATKFCQAPCWQGFNGFRFRAGNGNGGRRRQQAVIRVDASFSSEPQSLERIWQRNGGKGMKTKSFPVPIPLPPFLCPELCCPSPGRMSAAAPSPARRAGRHGFHLNLAVGPDLRASENAPRSRGSGRALLNAVLQVVGGAQI